MCLTKRKKKTTPTKIESAKSANSQGPTAATQSAVGGATATPVTTGSTTVQSAEKDKVEKGPKETVAPVKSEVKSKTSTTGTVEARNEKPKEGVKSDVDAKKSETKDEKVSELKKIADQATAVPRAPPVDPPKKLNAKRTVEGMKEAKDPEYVTLDDDYPKFENAKLKGFSEKEKETGKVEKTQPSSNEEKKKSGEKSTP